MDTSCSDERCSSPAYRRGLCRKHYRSLKPCSVDGCKRTLDSHGMCSMHVRRWKTHGEPGEVEARHRPNGSGHLRPDGYLVVKVAKHPLAGARGYAYAHRVALFDSIGAGEHPCYWCATSVTWEDGTLTADHKDWDRANNTPENLVPSCLPCNSKRYEERTDRGEANPMAKLNAAAVRAIRATTGTQREIADRFGISQSLVYQIKRRKIWSWLEDQTTSDHHAA